MVQAWETAYPRGPHDVVAVVLGHDNSFQFTPDHHRQVADELGITLSRTAYRHPDDNAFIERVFRTLKEEGLWASEFACFEEACAAVEAW